VRDVARYLIAEDMTVLSAPRRQIWRDGLFALSDHIADFLTGGEQDRFTARRTRLVESGIPESIANVLAGVPLADRGLNIIRLVEDNDRSPLEMAIAYARLGERSGINWLYQSLPLAQAVDVWDRIVLMDLRTGMLTLQRELTAYAVASRSGDALEAVDAFLADHAAIVERVRLLEPETPAAPTASALAVVTQTLMRLRSAMIEDEEG
jgi:NAD-specific glutamate dehydrogenase